MRPPPPDDRSRRRIGRRFRFLIPILRLPPSALRPCSVAFALAAALYAVTLGGTYVYDDTGLLLTDDRLRDPSHWGRYWTESYNGGVDNLYRPLASMTFAVGWWLHGDRPWAFHLVNVLLHAGASAAVAVLAGRLASPAAAWVAGLLFAAHPVHVEVVAGLYGRAESMATLATLGGLAILVGGELTARRALAVWACFVAALLSKEQGMLFPVLALSAWGATRAPTTDPFRSTNSTRSTRSTLLSRLRLRKEVEQRCEAASGSEGIVTSGRETSDDSPPARVGAIDADPRIVPIDPDPRTAAIDYARPAVVRDVERRRRAGLLLVTAVCLALAGYVVWRESILKFWWDRSFLDPTIQPMVRSAGLDRWLIPLALLGRYAGLMLLPWRLSIDHGYAVIGPTIARADPYLWLGVAFVVAWIAALSWAVARRRRGEAFALLAAAVAYAPVANALTLIGTVFGERLIYLPSAFALLWVGLVADRLPRRRALTVALAIVVVAASARTVAYAARWNDRLAFYESSLADQPRSVRLHLLTGVAYLDAGRPADAARVAASLRSVAPWYADGWVLGGRAAIRRGDLAEAERLFDAAMARDPLWGQALHAELRDARAAAGPDAPIERR